MNDAELLEIVQKIRNAKAEFQTIEVKSAHKDTPKKLYDTLSSFSNQDDGGIIVFGLDEQSGFDIKGVYDVHDLQRKVMEQCEQMEPVVRAVFTAAETDGKYVVSAEVPSIDITERPCYYKGKGRLKGSYVRVGDADKPMTEYEIYSYEAFRKKYRDDVRTVDRALISSLDKIKLDEYIINLKKNKENIKNLENSQILELMGMINENKTTLSSQFLFGLYPQAYFPQLCITAIVVPGVEIGETAADGARFIDNQRIEGTIPDMLDAALKFVRNNIHNRTIIDKNGKRCDRTDYPMNSVREALLNALVHRDYSVHTEGMPIQLIIFTDRLEIRNPGGLYGRLTIDTLGKAQPDTRNPVLATALEILKITENRYSGIPTIRREMMEYSLPEPEFYDEHGEFSVILRKQLRVGNKESSVENDLIKFCKTPRTRNEIADFLGLGSVSYALTRYLRPLINSGKIKLLYPDKPSSRKQMYSAD